MKRREIKVGEWYACKVPKVREVVCGKADEHHQFGVMITYVRRGLLARTPVERKAFIRHQNVLMPWPEYEAEQERKRAEMESAWQARADHEHAVLQPLQSKMFAADVEPVRMDHIRRTVTLRWEDLAKLLEPRP